MNTPSYSFTPNPFKTFQTWINMLRRLIGGKKTKIPSLLIALLLINTLCIFGQKPPEGAVHENSDILLDKTPDEDHWAQARCDVATLKNGVANNGTIEIDYLEVIQENLTTGEIKSFAREDYNVEDYVPDTFEAGLYLRNPWFVENDFSRKLENSVQKKGTLIIRVGEKPEFIAHFWTKCLQAEPNTRHRVIVRFRISGEIGFQYGLDYSPSSDCGNSVHTEAFFSKWFFDTKGEFLTDTFPDYSKMEKFGREHYGVYNDGKFFVSKQMVDRIEGTSVKLITGETAWVAVPMVLTGNTYQCDISKKLEGKIRYCFEVDGSQKKYIPHALENDLIYWEEDTQPNDDDGFDFLTEAIIPLKTERQIKTGNLKISYSPDLVYLNIFSPHKIKRLFVTDMGGRTSYDYRVNVPDKIVIASFNTGTYIVTIETDKGTFSEKFKK